MVWFRSRRDRKPAEAWITRRQQTIGLVTFAVLLAVFIGFDVARDRLTFMHAMAALGGAWALPSLMFWWWDMRARQQPLPDPAERQFLPPPEGLRRSRP